MAVPPSGPIPPNDPKKTGPKGKPVSNPDTDWLSEIEKMATPGPRKYEPDPDDAELDLRALFEDADDSGPQSYSKLNRTESPLPGEPDDGADVLMSPHAPVAPASGWLDVPPSNVMPKLELTNNSDEEDSEIFNMKTGPGTGGSDVLRILQKPTPSSSNIFDAPSPGSSRFSTPLDGTEKDVGGGEPASDDAMNNLDALGSSADAANQLMSELKLPFPSSDSDPKYHPDDSRPDFDRTDHGSSGSNLFADATEADIEIRDSGVDLLHPDTEVDSNMFAGPGSSIFGSRVKDDDASRVNVDEIPLMGSSDDRTDMMMFTGDDHDGTSHIFQTGHPGGIVPGGESSVSFNIPGRGKNARSQDATLQESGEIEWSLPEEHIDQSMRSKRMTADQVDLAGIPDLHTLAQQMDESGEMPQPLSSSQLPRREPQGSVSRTKHKSDPSHPGFTLPEVWTDEPKPAKKGLAGWFGGTAIGLIAGVGATAGVFLSGALSTSDTKPTNTTPNAIASTTPSSAPTPAAGPAAGGGIDLAQARALLAAGDVAQALPVLEAAGADAPVDVVAERGKARWLARVRELATSGEAIRANDPKLVAAVADLEAIVQSKEPLKTDAEKQIAVESALRLGLTKELANDVAGAMKIYTEAASRFPTAKKVFETSLNRVKAMQSAGARVSLTPRQAHELAEVATLSLVMLQTADVIKEQSKLLDSMTTDEPGFLFWEAVNQATAERYSAAVTAITKAKAAHNERRLKHAGKGLNPLSDPLEQIFLRTCDDLKDYWTLRQQLYTHPAAGPMFAKAGIAGTLDSLATKAKSGEALQTQVAELSTKLKTALDEATQAGKQKDAAFKELLDSKDALQTQQKELRTLRAQTETAMTLLAQKTEFVAEIVKTLKRTKFVDDKVDEATVQKNLPDILQKLAVTGSSADVEKAKTALLAAIKEVETAQTAVKVASDKAKSLEAKLATTVADAEKQLQQAKAEKKAVEDQMAAEVKKATDAAQAQMAKQLEDAKAKSMQELVALQQQNAELVRQRQQAEKNAAAQIEKLTEEYDRRVANARTGIAVPLSTSESIAKDRAVTHYNTGIELYFSGRYPEAEAEFTRATQADASDARYWYFTGLSRFAQGKADAVEAYKRGADCEARNQPNSRDINAALERVNSAARQSLGTYRP